MQEYPIEAVICRNQVEAFLDSGVGRHTLGLVYGRRRIGKSTLLEAVAHARGGFYWEATRTESAVQRTRLGETLGAHLGVGRLSFDTWEEALRQLLRFLRLIDTQVPRRLQIHMILDNYGKTWWTTTCQRTAMTSTGGWPPECGPPRPPCTTKQPPCWSRTPR